MKICSFFNICNYPYIVTKLLRRKGIDAELIVDISDILPNMLPFWEEYNIKLKKWKDISQIKKIIDEYSPSWVKYIKKGKFLGRYGSYSINLLKMLKKYDIIHAYTMGAIWAQFSNRPYIATATGADIRELSKQRNIKGYLMRRGFKNAKVLYAMPINFKDAKEIGCRNIKCIKWPIELEIFDKSRKMDLKGKYGADIIFFTPTRHDKIKGMEILIRAFAKFIRENEDILLLSVEWGNNLDRSKFLIKKFGIEDKVVFLPLMSKKLLLSYYKSSDCIFDQFVLGGMGTTCLEALASGKPLVTYLNKKLYSEYYEKLPPILNAKNEEEIYNAMIKVEDRKMREYIGREARKWIKKNHHWKLIIEELIKEYYNIANN